MMRLRRVVAPGACVLIVLLSTGCFTTHMAAPAEGDIPLVILPDGGSEDEFDYTKDYRNWYLLFGILPIFEKQPEEFIGEEKLREVRVQTQDTAWDAVIAILLSPLTILPQSITIEGNR